MQQYGACNGDGAFILRKEMEAVQMDLVRMEGLLHVLVAGAYHETRAEYIGNSLEILNDYLGQSVERLGMAASSFLEYQTDASHAAGEEFSGPCSSWEAFAADEEHWELRSEDVIGAYTNMEPYLELLPEDGREELVCAARELEAASRKQGFLEGYSMAAGRCTGNDGNGNGRT